MGKGYFGTIRALASGRFQARYRLPNGEQVTAGTFDSEEAAREALEAVAVDIRRGDHWDDRKSKTRFSEFMTMYLEYREPKVRPGTFRNDQSYLKCHLLPVFGGLQMRDIDVQSVDAWWTAMPATQTRKNTYFLLKKALDYAVRWGYLRSNPAMVEEPGKDVSVLRPTWSYAAFQRVLEHVPTEVLLNNSKTPVRVFYREALEVLFSMHLRLGELIALDAADYDRKAGTISVTKQVTDTSHGEATETKTGQGKVLTPLTLGKNALGRMPARFGGPLFVGPRGGRLPRATLRAVWNDAVALAGYENFHLHDLRHVSLSLVAETGAPLKDIQNRGGHASVQSAMRYQHTNADRDAAVAAAADALLMSV